MDVWHEVNWFAVHTKPLREDVAANYICRLGVEVLLPKTRQRKLIWGTARELQGPLFPGYLFARFRPSTYLHLIKFARGVRQVLCYGDVLLPVDEGIIRAIQSRVGKDGLVEVHPHALTPGDKVIINHGPLQGLRGIFERELGDQDRVTLLLQAIEYQAHVSIEARYLKAARQ
jgi:transcriptional antiterminator RfaH